MIIWIVLYKDFTQDFSEWVIYDLCLTEEAAEKSLKEGEEKYLTCKFLVDAHFAHN